MTIYAMIKRIKEYLSINKYLVISALVFLLARLILLDQLFLLHDERDIVFSGYSIAKTAHDLFRNFLPISFTGISPDNPLVSIYYSALWWLALPVRSVFLARLPYVLISTVLIFLIYEIIYHISRDKKLALLSSVIFAFSPWVFHVTRLALDLPLAAVTLFAGILFYLKEKRWFAYALFFLTFYNYQGFRVVIPFLLIYLEFIWQHQHMDNPAIAGQVKQFIRKNVLNILFILFLFLSITLIDKSVTTNRFSQVAFLSPQRFTQEVNLRRAAAQVPLTIRAVFHNKISVAADYLIDNFVKGQDISYLFKTGDYSPINGNAVGGQFFFAGLLFYYVGIMALGKRLKKEDFYIIGFIFLGLLPAMASVNSATYSIRGFLSTIGYAYLLSLGVLFGTDLLKKITPRYRTIVLISISLIVLLNVVYFTYNYYLRRPATVGELFKENEHQLSMYLMHNPNKVYRVFHDHPKDVYLSYLFLNNDIKTPQLYEEDVAINTFPNGNVTFLKCPKIKNYLALRGAILSETCVDLKTHDMLNDPFYKIKKIPYKDLSLKTAYFILE